MSEQEKASKKIMVQPGKNFMKAKRIESLKKEGVVFCVMEGLCPHCAEASLEPTGQAGYPDWLKQRYGNVPTVGVWQKHPDFDGFGDVGVVFHECGNCSKKVEVYATSGGDWNVDSEAENAAQYWETFDG
jgi:hypothetical protein